jgi:hypothetical protein
VDANETPDVWPRSSWDDPASVLPAPVPASPVAIAKAVVWANKRLVESGSIAERDVNPFVAIDALFSGRNDDRLPVPKPVNFCKNPSAIT